MDTNINLNLFAVPQMLASGKLPSFSRFNLKFAKANLFQLPTGRLLVQSICHYLVNISLYEYEISLHTEISVTVNAPTVVMIVMLKGHSIFYDSSNVKEPLKESHGNCCYLSYVAAGNYTRTFLTGTHQILMLTIPASVLEEQSTRFNELKPVLNSYQSESKQYLTLGNAPIAKGILRLLNVLNSKQVENGKTFDKKVHSFLLESLESYNNSLEQSKIYDELQKQKADEIAQFLLKNYADDIANHRTKLAEHFGISEATLLRLAKRRFGKSLYQHVIELRLLYALKQLMTTDAPIKDVALSVGYYDSRHFSRAFKQHFNISPNQIDNLKPTGLINGRSRDSY